MGNQGKMCGGALAVSVAMLLAGGMSASANETLKFNMAWLPQGSVAGPIIAQQKGWFAEAGLTVEISRGYGGSRTANEVDQGLFDVGYVDPIAVALNRKNGGTLRMIGVVNAEWPAGICYVKNGDDDVRGVDDLLGLKMGGGTYSPVHSIMPAWLEMNGKQSSEIGLLRLEPAVVDASLLEGRIDLAECWRASNRAVLEKLAAGAGKSLGWVEYADHGLNAYGSGFSATEAMIAERPEVLKAFLEASYRGYEFAMEQPEAAAQLLQDAYPSLDMQVTLQQVEELGSILAPDGQVHKGFDPARMQDTLALIVKAFGVPEGSMEASDIYTNTLVE